MDCSGYARAVEQCGERLEQIRRWQQRIDAEASEFQGTASRFGDLLENDLPRTEEHLLALDQEPGGRPPRPGSRRLIRHGDPTMVTRPDRDGDQQLRLLDDAWDKASQHWHDGMARQFEGGHWTPLLRESRGYLEGLRKLMDMLEAAERDTEG